MSSDIVDFQRYSQDSQIQAIYAKTSIGSQNPDDLHLYEILTPYRPKHISGYPFRGAIGSGGEAAKLILQACEEAMRRFELNWGCFSSLLLSQFEYILMGRVLGYDLYTGLGTTLWRVSTHVTKELPIGEIFPKQVYRKSKGTNHLPNF